MRANVTLTGMLQKKAFVLEWYESTNPPYATKYPTESPRRLGTHFNALFRSTPHALEA